jgi:hypothetical protein
VQGELKVKAQAAGCDAVLPRSAFSQNLPQILNAPPGNVAHALLRSTLITLLRTCDAFESQPEQAVLSQAQERTKPLENSGRGGLFRRTA